MIGLTRMAPDPIEVVNPSVRIGRFRHALLDFDGTISVIREGWERVMMPLMIERIAGDEGDPDGAIRREVERYVDQSTGLQTILQMDWLAQAVARRRGADEALSAEAYKALYNERLLHSVRERLERLERGEVPREEMMIAGAEAFVRGLAERGVRLYVASGTDVEDVRHEAAALGVADYFQGRIFGAVGDIRVEAKRLVLKRIFQEHGLSGSAVVTFGDGPVEMRQTRKRDGVAVGVASDEVRRFGLNPAKRSRLIRAGADLLVPDFSQHQRLLAVLFGE